MNGLQFANHLPEPPDGFDFMTIPPSWFCTLDNKIILAAKSGSSQI